MRILTVTHFYAAHGGGIERVAGHLCRRFAAQGHDSQWAASAADAPPADPAITPLPLACINPTEALTGLPMPIPGPRSALALVRAIRRSDVVVIHDALYVTSIIAMIAARLLRRRTVLVQHIAALDFASAPMRAIMRLATIMVTHPMLRAAGQVVFISAAVRAAFATVRLRRPARLCFNGVDRAVFTATPADADEGAQLRGKLGLPPAGRIIAFVGRFVPKKGLAILRECAARRPDLTFVLAGSGPIDPASWGLANVVIAGLLPPDGIAALLRSAGVMLLPSVGEGYPLVVQEALACGLPVICGLDSAAADPDAGCFLRGIQIDPGDPVGTAERILPMLDLPDWSDEERDRAARYAAQTYSWDRMAQDLIDAAA